MYSFHFIIVLWSCIPFACAQKSGWTCENDGYWYQDGVQSAYTCGDDDKSGAQASTTKGGGTGGDKEADKSGFTGKDESLGGNYGWTCTGGYWIDPEGANSFLSCTNGESLKDPEFGDKESGNGCGVTYQGASVMASLTRTCIDHPSYIDGRCWWTHVPSEVAAANDGRKVPLIIDMHGGGGCASDQYSTSGLASLADTNASSGGGMIIVWPQGGEGGLWASTGTSTRTALDGNAAKSVPQWNDIGFIEQLIANMIRNSTHKNKIDPERVYLTGFSLGCMMAHRFAMERSSIIAGFFCHGGELSLYPTNQTEMDSDKSAYNIQPMPAYLTIGSADAWFSGANASWYAWKYWNSCTGTSQNTLTTSGFVENIASPCATYTPALQTVMLNINGGGHTNDVRAYENGYQFVSQFKRAGVMANLIAAASEVTPSPAETQSGKVVTVSVNTLSFSHSWNGGTVERTYGLAMNSSCASVAGIVAQLSPDGNAMYCDPWPTITAQCILVVCPYTPTSRGWKATSSGGDDSEDTDFIAALIQDLIQTHSAPAEKVIVSGFSFGGTMSYRVWCEKSDVVRGIVPIGQTWLEPAVGHPGKTADMGGQTSTQYVIGLMEALPQADRCNPQFKRPHLARVGTQDSFYGQDIGVYDGKVLWERLSTTVLGCTGSSEAIVGGQSNSITGQTGSTCYQFPSCTAMDPGLNKYCTVQGMGHDTIGWPIVINSAFSVWFDGASTTTTEGGTTSSGASTTTIEGATTSIGATASSTEGATITTSIGVTTATTEGATTTTTPSPTTTEATEIISGSVSFTAANLSTQDVETAATKSLAQEFGVNETDVGVTAIQTRRLERGTRARMLAGSWVVSFTISVPSSQAAAAVNTASSIQSDTTSFKQAMKTNLQALGVSDSDATITVTSFVAALVTTTTYNDGSTSNARGSTSGTAWAMRVMCCLHMLLFALHI